MGAYGVYQNPNPRTRATVPFLLDVQSEVLSMLGTRLVVPLYRPDAAGGAPLSRLCPVLSFEGQALVAMVPEAAGIPLWDLGTLVGDLANSRNEVLQALDLLLTGF